MHSGYFPLAGGYIPKQEGNIPKKTETIVLETVVCQFEGIKAPSSVLQKRK